MARDRVTGKFLPEGLSNISGTLSGLRVRDDRGRFIGGDRAEAIVSVFRHRREATSEQRIVYDSWQFLMTGQSPGRRDEPVTDGEADILRRWIHDPTLTRDSSRLARLRQILQFYTGGAPVDPEDLCTLGTFPIKPYTQRYRLPETCCVIPDGNVPAQAERRGQWLATEVPDLCEAYGKNSLRRIANLPDWRTAIPSLPQDTFACTSEILGCAHTLHVAPGSTPAGMAWRYFRTFLHYPLPPLPLDAMALAHEATAEYVILGPILRGPTDSYIYDVNHAYAYWLKDWPELGCGRWVPVTKWTHHIAIYQHRAGVIGGQALLEGWDLEPYRTWRRTIERGWAWEGDFNVDSGFRRFVDACLAYQGPGSGLVKRFPSFVVGKSRSAQCCDGVLYTRGSYYPILWANIVGALQARMITTLRRVEWIAAYIDAIHLREPLPTDWLGTRPGLWKLIDAGPTTYAGVGRWTSPHTSRHQGVPA